MNFWCGSVHFFLSTLKLNSPCQNLSIKRKNSSPENYKTQKIPEPQEIGYIANQGKKFSTHDQEKIECQFTLAK